jgi:hypothetical protein
MMSAMPRVMISAAASSTRRSVVSGRTILFLSVEALAMIVSMNPMLVPSFSVLEAARATLDERNPSEGPE